MASPAVERRFRGIVIGVVVERHIDRFARFDIAVIFFLQCRAVIFEVIEDHQGTMRRVFHKAGANRVGSYQGSQPCY